MSAKLSNFENSVLGKATTVCCIPGTVIFNNTMQAAVQEWICLCTSILSADSLHQTRISNLVSIQDWQIMHKIWMKYYEILSHFFLLVIYKNISIFCGYVRELRKKNPKIKEVEMLQQKCAVRATAMSPLPTALFHCNSFIVVTMKWSFKVIY